MSKNKIAEVTTQVYDLLSPLETTDRNRVVAAVLTLLGEDPSAAKPKTHAAGGAENESATDGGTISALPMRAGNWLKQNGLSAADLEHVFHIDGGKVEVIVASAPGKNNKVRTLNTYVLQGLRALLETGEATFDDKGARALCGSLGCYDSANHAVYISDSRQYMLGDKSKGWKLTGPGMTQGAGIIKELNATK